MRHSHLAGQWVALNAAPMAFILSRPLASLHPFENPCVRLNAQSLSNHRFFFAGERHIDWARMGPAPAAADAPHG